jgi:hypothetical protein
MNMTIKEEVACAYFYSLSPGQVVLFWAQVINITGTTTPQIVPIIILSPTTQNLWSQLNSMGVTLRMCSLWCMVSMVSESLSGDDIVFWIEHYILYDNTYILFFRNTIFSEEWNIYVNWLFYDWPQHNMRYCAITHIKYCPIMHIKYCLKKNICLQAIWCFKLYHIFMEKLNLMNDCSSYLLCRFNIGHFGGACFHFSCDQCDRWWWKCKWVMIFSRITAIRKYRYVRILFLGTEKEFSFWGYVRTYERTHYFVYSDRGGVGGGAGMGLLYFVFFGFVRRESIFFRSPILISHAHILNVLKWNNNYRD